MLVHGTAMSDRRSTRCWGRIPETLRAMGANVCFGRQDAWGSTPTNVEQLKVSVDSALAAFGAEKVNIIAHSKGGLDSRALANLPEYAGKIASITTVSTPHRGIGWLSKIWPFSFVFIVIASGIFYPLLRLFPGDKKPNMYKLAKIMTKKGCEKFNAETPDNPNIFYQSFAGNMTPSSSGGIFFITRIAANRFDGENDGLIPVETAKWGLFRGTLAGGGKRGLSHADEIDFFKRDFEGENVLSHDDETYTSVPEIYARIVNDLKSREL